MVFSLKCFDTYILDCSNANWKWSVTLTSGNDVYLLVKIWNLLWPLCLERWMWIFNYYLEISRWYEYCLVVDFVLLNWIYFVFKYSSIWDLFWLCVDIMLSNMGFNANKMSLNEPLWHFNYYNEIFNLLHQIFLAPPTAYFLPYHSFLAINFSFKCFAGIWLCI